MMNKFRSQRGKEETEIEDSDMPESVVSFWLGFLHMDQYTQEFLDNGYDDLETVKQVGPADLDAIGVSDHNHRAFLLDAIRVLREHGAVWVYLLQNGCAETAANVPSEYRPDPDPDMFFCDRGSSSGIASANSSSCLPTWTEDENSSSSSSHSKRQTNGSSPPRCTVELTADLQVRTHRTTRSSSRWQSSESSDLIQRVSDLSLEDEATNDGQQRYQMQQLLPSVKVCLILKEKLSSEGISLAAPPFTSTGSDIYLHGLASRYSQELNFPYHDVIQQLEDLRLAEIAERPQHFYSNIATIRREYSPGNYGSSTCSLSDNGENDVYDFATKYEGRGLRENDARSPGWLQMAKKALCRRSSKSSLHGLSTPPTRTRLRPHPHDTPTLNRRPAQPMFPVSAAFYGHTLNSGARCSVQLLSHPNTPLVKSRTTRLIYDEGKHIKAAEASV